MLATLRIIVRVFFTGQITVRHVDKRDEQGGRYVVEDEKDKNASLPDSFWMRSIRMGPARTDGCGKDLKLQFLIWR
jgi:hypothetical protein